MNVTITLNLSHDDIESGMTAQNIVDMVFPYSVQEVSGEFLNPNIGPAPEPEVEVQEEETTAPTTDARTYETETTVEEVLEDQAKEVNTDPGPGQLPPDELEALGLDVAGVPWDGEIHSSGKSKYQTGPDKGRWTWRRGSNPEERERIASVLAEEVARSQPKSGSADTDGQSAPVITPPGPPTNGAVGAGPRPDNPPAAPGPVAPRPDNPGGELTKPVSWKALLNALDEHDIDADSTFQALQAIGVDEIALLAIDGNQEQRDALATQLGLV